MVCSDAANEMTSYYVKKHAIRNWIVTTNVLVLVEDVSRVDCTYVVHQTVDEL